MQYTLLLLLLFVFSVSSQKISAQEYNETERIAQFKELFGITLPPFKIPDILNPEQIDSPSIKGSIPVEKEFGLPTLPNLLPTALPKINLPTIKIPDLIPTALPTIKIPDIPKILPTIKIPDLIPTALPEIKIPDIPKIIPTLPPIKIPTIKIPDLIPTALPFNIPTIKLPTLPHLLPTALPTLFPIQPIPSQGVTPNTPYTLPYPLPSDMSPIPFLNNNTYSTKNLFCVICENTVTIVKARFQLLEKDVRNKVTSVLTTVCGLIEKVPAIAIFSTPCNLLKANMIDKAFKKLDDWEATVVPESVCRIIPFCK